MSAAEPTPGELLWLLLPIAVVSLAMVVTMVQWSHRLLDLHPTPAVRARGRLWGVAYGLAWVIILALFARLLAVAGTPGSTAKNVAVVALVVGGFWGLHALIVVFGRAIQRANERAGGRPRAGAAERVPEDADAAPAAADEVAEARGVAAPPPAPAVPLQVRALAVVQRVVRMALLLAGVLLVIGLAELIPPLKDLEAFLAVHQGPFLTAAIALAAVGFVLLMGGAIHMVLTAGQPVSHAEAEALARRRRDAAGGLAVWRKSASRIRGAAVGGTAADQATFREVKEAWRSGAWRRSRRWRRMFAMAAGAALMTVGLFGIPVVLGPPGIKLVFGGAVVYAVVRTVQGFVRA